MTTSNIHGNVLPPSTQNVVALWHGEPPTKAAGLFEGNGPLRATYAPVCSTVGRAYRSAEFDIPPLQVLVGAPRRSLEVNYLAPVTVARSAHAYLRYSRGHLVFFTSSSYTRGRAGYSLYSSTKAAVVNLTQPLADEWAQDGICVNVVNPERTRTLMRLQAFGEEPDDSLLESEVVAASTLDVLVSRVTGQVIDVRRTPAATGRPDAQLPVADAIAQALAEVEMSSGTDPVAGGDGARV